MKAISTLVLLLISLIGSSQTIVSTSVENKNVILEEFTGIHCGYCPQGHVTAQGIIDDHPNDVFVINVHTGYYANPTGSEPDFRTSFGNAIASQSGLTGYPSGTVNRHLFSGSATALGRSQWTGASNQILAEQSYVNVGVEATLNLTTRELTVHVEAYYTNDSPESTNKLNVVVLQDSTHAYQASGGSNYNHMHRLVDMITGQWGEEITTTSSGSFVDKTYTYSIPIDYNNVLVDLMHIKVVAFISENNQEIISGSGTYPSYTGSIIQNDVALEKITIPEEVCETSLNPIVTIKNLGQENLTSLIFDYSVNGGTVSSYSWSGNIPFGATEDITLDEISYTLLENNTLSVTSKMPNNVSDENFLNNEISKDFTEAFHTTTRVTMDLKPGPWGFEISWELFNPAGEVVFSGSGSNGDDLQTFNLDLNSCYVFNLYDSYGNGFKPGGSLKLTGSDGIDIKYVEGDFGSIDIIPFKAATVSSINEINNYIKIYPNPTYKTLIIEKSNIKNIYISDISGKIVLSKKYDNLSKVEIDFDNLESGIYFVNIYTDKDIITKKISVVK